MLLLGSHVSFSGSQLLSACKLAIDYGANTFMIYTGAPANSIRKPINKEYTEEAHKLMKENGIDINNVICHAPYIINLANKEKNTFGITFLKGEITRCEHLGITKLVLHPGSASGISKEDGIKNIIDALNIIMETNNKVMILLETMAGKGSECGSTLKEIATIINGVKNKKLLGVCIDTCHLNDSGYNLNSFDDFLTEFDQLIGINRIKCVHLNDTKNPLGSHKDRHENIGYGTIGFDNIINIVYHPKLKDVPKILETPFINDLPPYKTEIAIIKNKKFTYYK